MKHFLHVFLLVFTFTISSYAQNDWNTYPVRSIADIIKAESNEAAKRGDIIISGDPFPSKTTVTYTGKSRPISKYTKDFIDVWVQTRNVPKENADLLREEYLFKERDKEYWIPVIKTLVPFFSKELKEGDEIVIYYFYLGGFNEQNLIEKDTSLKTEKPKSEADLKDKGKIEWKFAVEEYRKPDSKPPDNSNGSTYINQPLAVAVDGGLKNSEKKNGFLIDARQVKSKSKVIYTGEIREVSEMKMRFLKLWLEGQGFPLGILELLKHEAFFREGDKDYWLPIRKKISDDMAQQIKKGDEVVIHTIFIGGLSQTDPIEWVFVVGEFSR